MKKVIVRAFGARLLDGEETVSAVLFAQNQFWNKLVEIDHAHTEAYRQIVNTSSAALAEVTQQIEQEVARLEALKSDRAARRAATRSKRTEGDKAISAQMKDAATGLKELGPQPCPRHRKCRAARNFSACAWHRALAALLRAVCTCASPAGCPSAFHAPLLVAFQAHFSLETRRWTAAPNWFLIGGAYSVNAS